MAINPSPTGSREQEVHLWCNKNGQTQDVNVYQIVAKDTIEERILKLQEKKNELARQFTDGTASGGVGTLSKDDLLGLLS